MENFYPIYTGMEQTPITKKFIQEVERLRGTPAGKDYKEIAAKIGMDKTTMSNIIKGRRNIPYEVYIKFAEIFRIEDDIRTGQTSAIGLIAEYVIKMDARLEVVTNLLIETMAAVKNESVVRISTDVKQALDLEISMRKDELKQRG